jgi:hypothetical protein
MQLVSKYCVDSIGCGLDGPSTHDYVMREFRKIEFRTIQLILCIYNALGRNALSHTQELDFYRDTMRCFSVLVSQLSAARILSPPIRPCSILDGVLVGGCPCVDRLGGR